MFKGCNTLTKENIKIFIYQKKELEEQKKINARN